LPRKYLFQNEGSKIVPIYLWIIITTLVISIFAWAGLVLVLLKEALLRNLLPVLVAFSAGTLLGGAFLHLLMESIVVGGARISTFVWLLAGFSLFLVLEQFLQWHHQFLPNHGHSHYHRKRPVTYMILMADGLHNFIGGLAIGSSFLVSVETGLITAFAAAAHEIPQELGDFGILIQGGWNKYRALTANFISALTIVFGGIIAYILSGEINTTFLLPFAAGNFMYIAAADLIPEIKHETNIKRSSIYFAAFIFGIGILLVIKLVVNH